MKPLSERFWPKVDIRDHDECWPWLGGLQTQGYGQIHGQGKNHKILATHVMWSLFNGNMVPQGCIVLHSCDNPPCVNPNHLFLGTYAQNTALMRLKGRHPRIRPEND